MCVRKTFSASFVPQPAENNTSMKISFPVFSPENSTIKTFFFTKNIIANAIKKNGGAIETLKRLQH